MPAPINEEALMPVRPKDGRPLPVSGVVMSPGPVYPAKNASFPDCMGSGRKVTIQHRHVAEGDPIPPPGPGEYDPESPYGSGWQSREQRERMFGWRSGACYYPRPDADKPTREGRVVTDEATPRPTEDRSAGLNISKDALMVPGPGQYSDETRNMYQAPQIRHTWRFNPVFSGRSEPNEDDPCRVHKQGKTLGFAMSPRKPSGVPGPGSYDPRGDRRGGGELGQRGTDSSRHRQLRPPTPPSKGQDQTQVPGPGHYDQSQMTCAKQAQIRPITMMGRPLEAPESEGVPGPGAYAPGGTPPPGRPGKRGRRPPQDLKKQTAHEADRALRKHVHGPRWAPPKQKVREKEDLRDYPARGTSEFGRHGAGVTIAPPQQPQRSPRCPFQKGEGVTVFFASSAGQRATVVDHALSAVGLVYRVRMERSKELREVDASRVFRNNVAGIGPGQYDLEAADRFGRSGRHPTMQLPNERTSMAVSEARKTAGNPAPSEYFRDGDHPKSLGISAPAHTFGQRMQRKGPTTDIGPGQYDPKPPKDFTPYAGFKPGAVLSFRPATRVRVKADVDEVREACDRAGIREWKDGKEWRGNRTGAMDDTEISKDDFCGVEGVVVTHGGMLRARAAAAHGPNRERQPAGDKVADGKHDKEAAAHSSAPWAPFTVRSREAVRVVFNDPQRETNGAFPLQSSGGWVEWTYPPEALQRNGLQFEEANARDGWAAAQTKSPGGPASYHPQTNTIGACRERRDQQGGLVVEVPGATIKGKPPPPAPPQIPGPGQHWEDEMPSTLSARGAVIGTGV